MNFTKIANTRQSCRAYDAERAVEAEKIEAILESARLAPSACNGHITLRCATAMPQSRWQKLPKVSALTDLPFWPLYLWLFPKNRITLPPPSAQGLKIMTIAQSTLASLRHISLRKRRHRVLEVVFSVGWMMPESAKYVILTAQSALL